MKLKIITYTGEETLITHIDEFEFRKNNVSSWLKVKYTNGTMEIFRYIATIKSVK